MPTLLEILQRVARRDGRVALRKDYVLVLLFVKYVSDKYADVPGAPIEVPRGGRFADMAALKGDKINKIIGTSWPRPTTCRLGGVVCK